jgi:hypothetical protein
MKVREDVTVWPNDKAGAFTLNRARPTLIAALITFIGRTLEEQVVKWRTFGDVVFLGNLYNNDTRRDGFEDFRKSIV